MKRLFSFLMCLGILICFCACDANPLNTPAIAESPAEDFSYEIHDGEVTITGYIGTDRKIRIPSKIDDRPVTTIGRAAFLKYDMTYIYIPETVTIIENSAFYKCVCLEEVIFTNGLVSIGEDAFSHCEALKECNLPNSLGMIENFAFAHCTSLKTVRIPKELKEIPTYAFSGCTALTKIDFSEGLEIIGYEAFSSCTSLEEIKLPESLQLIEADAFAECDNLAKLVIPKNTRLEVKVNETQINAYGIDAIQYSCSSPIGYQSWYGGNLIGVAPEHPTSPTPFKTILIVSKNSYAHTQLMGLEKYGCLRFEVQ